MGARWMEGLDLLERSPGEEFARAVANGERSVVVETRTLLDSTTDGGSPGLLLGGDVDAARPMARRRHVRDLMRVVPMGMGTTTYVREVAAATADAGASAVAEGAAKTELNLEFAGGTVRPAKAAAWVPATDEIYEDAPTLAAFVDGRLGEAVGLAEDWELINGDGTGEHYLGFLAADIGSQPFVTSIQKTITASARQIEDAGGMADGVIVGVDAYWDVFDIDSQWWRDLGLAVVRTNQLPASTAIVGAFGVGATVRERTSATIRKSDSHSDYFVNNKLAVVGEIRGNLVVHKGEYFIEAALA